MISVICHNILAKIEPNAQIICLKQLISPEHYLVQIADALADNFTQLICQADRFCIDRANLILFSSSSGGALTPTIIKHALKQ